MRVRETPKDKYQLNELYGGESVLYEDDPHIFVKSYPPLPEFLLIRLEDGTATKATGETTVEMVDAEVVFNRK